MFFSGRIKGYDACLEKLIEFKKNNDVIFFCSLNCSSISDYEKKFLDELDIKEGQLNYKLLEYPEWITTISIPSWYYVNRPNIYSHFYNNNECIKLIEKYQNDNNIVFDCIIKYRADIISEFVLDIPRLLDDNTVYIPNDYDWTGLNDQIAYGNAYVMKIYSSLFERIFTYCNCFNIPYHPETLTLYNINVNNIKVQRFYYPYILDPSRYN